MPDLFSPAGREVGLVLETWQLVQEASLIEIMVMWTRHVNQGDELKYGSIAIPFSMLQLKSMVSSYFCLLILNPCHIPSTAFALQSSVLSCFLFISVTFYAGWITCPTLSACSVTRVAVMIVQEL